MHLASHLGGKPEWREEILAFVPGEGLQKRICAGAVNGVFGLAEVLADGYQAGSRAALDAGYKTAAGSLPKVQPRREEASVALFQVPHEKPTARAPKQFVDPQNDVTAAAIELACREEMCIRDRHGPGGDNTRHRFVSAFHPNRHPLFTNGCFRSKTDQPPESPAGRCPEATANTLFTFGSTVFVDWTGYPATGRCV